MTTTANKLEFIFSAPNYILQHAHLKQHKKVNATVLLLFFPDEIEQYTNAKCKS